MKQNIKSKGSEDCHHGENVGDEKGSGFFLMVKEKECRFKRERLMELGEVMQKSENGLSRVSAGYTYLGQFIDHDITKLKRGSREPSNRRVPVNELKQLRTPTLDLDSVYGDGFNDESIAIDTDSGEFLTGYVICEGDKRLQGYDLPRELDKDCKHPLIPDARNDENLIVSQLHLVFLKLHNRLIKFNKEKNPEEEVEALFEMTRKQTILLYQKVVLQDFMRKVIDPTVWDLIIQQNWSFLWDPCLVEEARMPLEFSAAAFRFGHAMVQKDYHLNKCKTNVSLEKIFEFTGKGGMAGKEALPVEMVIDWDLFFKVDESKLVYLFNHAAKICPSIHIKIPKNRPKFDTLATLNLLRGNELGLPSAQDYVAALARAHPKLCSKLGLKLLPENELNYPILKKDQKLLDQVENGLDFSKKTPLLYYILVEAFSQCEGYQLGSLGSLIVAETLKSLIYLSEPSCLTSDSFDETKLGLKASNGKYLRMVDLILFTQTNGELKCQMKK